MVALLPTRQAADLISGIQDYLTTTFALSNTTAQSVVRDFLTDRDNGMFKGPYVRLRLPFQSAPAGWEKFLEHRIGQFTPYGHQAQAYQRLSSLGTGTQRFRRPQPTLVTTGTGSGKTEAFLHPILDHVLRAQSSGITGMKALILYPMNALANDQAARLAKLLTEDPRLTGIRAAMYTGQDEKKRTRVTADGLINDRSEIRERVPDILLTNYKMLDQLLLRHDDARLWEDSATSLQYLVLDEFHTYDGAQGTDVAMLLRRLGITLKSYWPDEPQTGGLNITDEDRQRPLGKITPVATSATLGGSSGGQEMLHFAQTIFGEALDKESLITESRMDIESWRKLSQPGAGIPRPIEELPDFIDETNSSIETDREQVKVLEVLLHALFEAPPETEPEILLDALRHHPLTRVLVEQTQTAQDITELAELLFPNLVEQAEIEKAAEFLSHILALYSHVRVECGRQALTVETHLWVRELSRIDAKVDTSLAFRWGDDPVEEAEESPTGEAAATYLPAVYCRHCGRYGWGTKLAPTQLEIITNPADIRQASAVKNSDFRVLLEAAAEADEASQQNRDYRETKAIGLRYYHRQQSVLSVQPPEDDDPELHRGLIIPVLCLDGEDAADQSAKDVCPACFAEDAIRFVGSAISTLTSVAISTLFGDADLDRSEKKALVFTDSVQDAAHRAGFIQARSRTFTLRTQLRSGFENSGQNLMTLPQLVDNVMEIPDTADERFHRFRLVPPDLVDRNGFAAFWQDSASTRDRMRATTNVRRRLLFDAALELGLNARLGRTLELTGAVVAEADTGSEARLLAVAKKAWDTSVHMLPETGAPSAQDYLHWARGVLIRMRLQGGILHDWLRRYIENDGRRYWVWGGRKREQGMPAFPSGRPAPAFPIVGSTAADGGLDPVTQRGSWYTDWTRRTLNVIPDDASVLIRKLFEGLADSGIVTEVAVKHGARAYALEPDQILLTVPSEEDLRAGQNAVQCSVCGTMSFGTSAVVEQMLDAPCLRQTCQGKQERGVFEPQNYYRELYASTDGKRVVAKEHTSVLQDKDRLSYEEGFKKPQQDPGDPNVLVATPTLEMGIDIGDLSCVMLASLPTSVASYVQRVGRAGRLTGNSLVVAFVQGRGQHLPKLNDPLSVINGDVKPPSTYLDAEEILMRQFVAFLGDRLAMNPNAVHPRTPKVVMQSVEPQTYLGQILEEASGHDAQAVEEFLAAFGDLVSDTSAQRLRQWVREDMADVLEHATVEWQKQLEALRHRIKDVDAAVDELFKAYEQAQHDYGHDSDHPKVKEAHRDRNSAIAQRKRLYSELAEINKDWWISALERYGVFPNYTLIGEPVVLNVGVSWRDEETQEFETESHELQRMADVAIRELAPGATFYAYGMEIAIDAVDMGPQQRNLQYWQICPGCGWINPVQHTGTAQGYSGLATDCARCEAASINDQGQIFTALEMSRVSAEIRRDETSISDNRDSRHRARFTVIPVNEVEPDGLESRWFVAENGFGVEYLRRTTVTSLNFGLASRRSRERQIASEKLLNAPLFTVCSYCGQVSKSRQENSKDDHRFWCQHRASTESHEVDLLLAHRLRTQGVKLHLPVEAAFLDDYSAPSLLAAVQLGLAEHLGGTTGQVTAFRLPTAEDSHAMSLLIHDRVPGGTGYLAAFKEPETVFALLKAAWEVVRNCSCHHENRRACHRCLLPYAPFGREDDVSAVVAERLLGELLEIETAGEPHNISAWTIQNEPVVRDASESVLEVQFRDALKKRLNAVNVEWHTVPTSRGEELRFQLSGQRFEWRLRPQQDMEGTRPDFVLIPGDVNLPQLAIYTDGFTYHATPAYNRVADDALKRHHLRQAGDAIPWSVTYQDVEQFDPESPQERATPLEPNSWMGEAVLGAFQQEHSLKPSILDAIGLGNMELLWAWIQEPELEHWQRLADLAPALAFANKGPSGPTDEASAIQLRMTPHQVNTHLKLVTADQMSWGRSLGALSLFSSGDLLNPRTGLRSILVLHDDDESIRQDDYQQAWQQWLTWTNLMAFSTHPGAALIASATTAQEIWEEFYGPTAEHNIVRPTVDVAQTAVPEGWELVFEEVEEDEHDFLHSLANHGVPVPQVGDELDGVMLQLAWPDQRVAVVYEPEDLEHVETTGWTAVLTEDTQGLLVALGHE